MRVLVLNAGSSTLKWTLLEGDDRSTLAAGNDAWMARAPEGRAEQLRETLGQIGPFDAVGHRVVHGGARFVEATVLDRGVRAELEALVELDPLHMRPALAGIDAVTTERPGVLQVVAFDTSFHATLPAPAAGYPLPLEWSQRWGLRRFGFHGLSVQHALERTRTLLGGTPARLIVCHLGSGCSITAIADGESIDTTMGFTPLEGVMMGTRAGSVDPGLLLHLLTHCGVSVEELADVLANRSGLFGVSGISGDLREVVAAAKAGSARATLAYEELVWSLRRAVGAMVGALGGVDALVFTGGIGENSAPLRGRIASSLAYAGLRLRDDDGEEDEDRLISDDESHVAALLVRSREDLVILAEVLRHGAPARSVHRSP